MKPTAWACRTCGKIDWADTDEQLAKPEHVSHRGYDIGTCQGTMIRLYAGSPTPLTEDQIRERFSKWWIENQHGAESITAEHAVAFAKHLMDEVLGGEK